MYFICGHLMLFQLQVVLAGAATLFLWIACGVFASNPKSKTDLRSYRPELTVSV